MPVDLQTDFDLSLAIGAISAGALSAFNTKIDASRENGFKIIKTRLGAQVNAKNGADGPVVFGVSCNINATELLAYLEQDLQKKTATPVLGPGQFVKILSYLPVTSTTGRLTSNDVNDVGSGVHLVDIGVAWTVPEGDNFGFFFWVPTGGADLASGMTMTAIWEWMGVWLRD